MSERDSLQCPTLDGKDNLTSRCAEHGQGICQPLRIRRLLKSCCKAGPGSWLLLFLVVMTTTFVYLTWGNTNECVTPVSPANPPRTAAGMADLLLGKLPGARVVSTRADGRIDRSFILTVRGADEDSLRSLPRVAERAEQWRGTVLCEWLTDWQPAELFLVEWGDYGLALPPFLFFGDKELLGEIQEALR
jgi:hypothetical protein